MVRTDWGYLKLVVRTEMGHFKDGWFRIDWGSGKELVFWVYWRGIRDSQRSEA